jgi:hypothetical protein
VFVCAPPFDEGEGPEEEDEGVEGGVFVCVGGVCGKEGEDDAEGCREDEGFCVCREKGKVQCDGVTELQRDVSDTLKMDTL